MENVGLPKIVSKIEWERELSEVLAKEKELTRLSDKVAAQRRRLPMFKVEKTYKFETEDGPKHLRDLFDGRRQLIVYHFMFDPTWEKGCPGCSWVVDAMSHPAHLNARGISLIIIGRAPLEKILQYKKHMGWKHTWASSFNSDFNYDFGATKESGENHGASVFLQDGNDIFQTYHTENRGVEHLGSHWTYLDLTPFGRQEEWEDSPNGWPKFKKYDIPRRHNEYPEDGIIFTYRNNSLY